MRVLSSGRRPWLWLARVTDANAGAGAKGGCAVTEQDIEVQVFRRGIAREGDERINPMFVPNAIDQLFQHWITPQLGAFVPRASVYQALVVLDGDEAEVFINEDAPFWAVAGEVPTICDPRDAFIGQIISLLPQRLEPTQRWMGFATAIDGRCVSLDLDDSLARVDELLGKAQADLKFARLGLEQDLLASAVEPLYAAAELSVMTMIFYAGWNDRRRHERRLEWLQGQIEAGEVPAAFGTAFAALYKNRNPARYVEDSLQLTLAEAQEHADTVGLMIDYARSIRPGVSPEAN